MLHNIKKKFFEHFYQVYLLCQKSVRPSYCTLLLWKLFKNLLRQLLCKLFTLFWLSAFSFLSSRMQLTTDRPWPPPTFAGTDSSGSRSPLSNFSLNPSSGPTRSSKSLQTWTIPRSGPHLISLVSPKMECEFRPYFLHFSKEN